MQTQGEAGRGVSLLTLAACLPARPPPSTPSGRPAARRPSLHALDTAWWLPVCCMFVGHSVRIFIFLYHLLFIYIIYSQIGKHSREMLRFLQDYHKTVYNAKGVDSTLSKKAGYWLPTSSSTWRKGGHFSKVRSELFRERAGRGVLNFRQV